MKHHLKVMNLAKQYNKRHVVKDVSLTLASGEVVGLLGPNGAGKTTSFYMIVGLVPCDKGQVWLDDKNITQLPMHARARAGIGYLPQEPSVFRGLTVWQNIMAVLELRSDLTRSQRQALTENLLDEFNLSPLKKQLGISLSGGERRRVEIARALASNPQFILLDEPFAGIDPISVIEIKNIIRQLKQRNLGILITDHNVRETLDSCEFAYIVNDGKILCAGTPNDILQHTEVRKVYLGDDFNL